MNELKFTRIVLYITIGLMSHVIFVRPIQDAAKAAESDWYDELRAAVACTDPVEKQIKMVIANWEMASVEDDDRPRMSVETEPGSFLELNGIQNAAGRVVEITADGKVRQVARFPITKGSTLMFLGKPSGHRFNFDEN